MIYHVFIYLLVEKNELNTTHDTKLIYMGIMTLQFFYSNKKIEFGGYKYPLNYSSKEFRIFSFLIFLAYIYSESTSLKNILLHFFSLKRYLFKYPEVPTFIK